MPDSATGQVEGAVGVAGAASVSPRLVWQGCSLVWRAGSGEVSFGAFAEGRDRAAVVAGAGGQDDVARVDAFEGNLVRSGRRLVMPALAGMMATACALAMSSNLSSMASTRGPVSVGDVVKG